MGDILSEGQRSGGTPANRLSLASPGDQATVIFLLSLARLASLSQVKLLGHEKTPHASWHCNSRETFGDLLIRQPSSLPDQCSTRKVVANRVIRNERCIGSGCEGGG
jgi:hypothetical protein